MDSDYNPAKGSAYGSLRSASSCGMLEATTTMLSALDKSGVIKGKFARKIVKGLGGTVAYKKRFCTACALGRYANTGGVRFDEPPNGGPPAQPARQPA